MQQNDNWNTFVRGAIDRCKENVRNYGKSVDYSSLSSLPSVVYMVMPGKRIDKRSPKE